jgi:hypothetical protein
VIHRGRFSLRFTARAVRLAAAGRVRAVLMRGIGVVRMIFGTVRRFGVSLAGAGGRCRWLIAALVASLVSVPLASAAAPIERAPAVGEHHRPPVGHAAFLESAAGKLALAVV